MMMAIALVAWTAMKTEPVNSARRPCRSGIRTGPTAG